MHCANLQAPFNLQKKLNENILNLNQDYNKGLTTILITLKNNA